MTGRPRLRLFGLVVLALVALTASLSPIAFAACSSSSAEENEPTVTATQTGVATVIQEPSPTPTATATPTEVPTPTAVPTPRPRTISNVFELAEAGATQIVVGGASEYKAGAQFTLGFGTKTQEDITVVEARFEHRPGRGVNVLLLASQLLYAHSVGESVTSLIEARPVLPKPTIPIPTPSEPQVPENVTFVFDPATSAEDQQAIRLGVEYASKAFAEVFGQSARSITFQTVTSGCKGVVATLIASNVLCINVFHPDFARRPFELKLKTGSHEYFHNLQSTIGCKVGWDTPGLDAVWIGEGSAEYYGLWVVSLTGLADFDLLIAQLKLDVKTGTVGRLSEMESPPPPSGLDYGLAAVAMSYLVEKTSITTYIDYCEARASGQEWHTAFAESFGLTADEFYTQFEAYRANGFK